jgi:hypothetical protein
LSGLVSEHYKKDNIDKIIILMLRQLRAILVFVVWEKGRRINNIDVGLNA